MTCVTPSAPRVAASKPERAFHSNLDHPATERPEEYLWRAIRPSEPGWPSPARRVLVAAPAERARPPVG